MTPHHDPTFWLLARAGGIAAYVLLTASVVLGLTLSGRPLGRLVRPAVVTELHRAFALAGLGAIAAHGLALVADSAVHVSWAALAVPGLVDYRPAWTATGVIAADLMVAVHLSFRLRGRIGVRAWRRLHVVTFVAFALAAMHGLGAGTDSGQPWALAMYESSVALVAALTMWRVLARRRTPARSAIAATRPPAPGAAATTAAPQHTPALVPAPATRLTTTTQGA